jgi:hypothetical protein
MDALIEAKKMFNELFTLVLPKIQNIKRKKQQGATLSEPELSALERYSRIAKLIHMGKSIHFL